MLFKPLIDALVLVRDRIKNFEREFMSNEAQTRLSLVDPVLTALGWDPRNPSAVRVEFPVRQRNRNNKVDYALLDSQQKPIAFVEAKSLGTDLGLAQDQLFEYGTGESVPYAIATDGVNWAVHKRERQGANLLFKQLLAVSIADQPSTMVAVKLLSLWRGLLTSRSSIDQIAPALHSLETAPFESETLRTLNTESAPDGDEERTEPEYGTRERPLQDNDVEVSDTTFALSNPPDVLGRKPVKLTLPDGTTKSISSWSGKGSSMFVEIVRWLSNTDQLNIDLPWNEENDTHKRNILDKSVLINRNGNKKWQVRILSELFLLIDHNAKSSMHIAAKLLTDCGINSSEVKVTLASQKQ